MSFDDVLIQTPLVSPGRLPSGNDEKSEAQEAPGLRAFAKPANTCCWFTRSPLKVCMLRSQRCLIYPSPLHVFPLPVEHAVACWVTESKFERAFYAIMIQSQVSFRLAGRLLVP